MDSKKSTLHDKFDNLKTKERKETKEIELKNFLKYISETPIQNEEIAKCIDELKSIYQGDYRHRYSYIASYFYYDINSDIDKVNNINENIKLIYKNIKDVNNNVELTLIKQVDKLIDHVSLETIRIKDIKRVKDDLNKAQNQLAQAEQTAKRVKILKQEIEKSRQQYIAILGIFAAIILAFTASLSFTNSILSNIDKASIYKLTFIVLLIGMFIFNILNGLYNFINKIHFLSNNNEIKLFKNYIFWINLIIIIAMILDYVFYGLFYGFVPLDAR